MALFSLLRGSNTIRVRRADMKSGELIPEPIDFVCDIEIKAKRALTGNPGAIAEWQKVLDDPDSYELLPEDLRMVLGFTFSTNLLGVDGDYRKLYWRVKQEQDRRAVTPTESEDDDAGIFTDNSSGSIGFDFGYSAGEEA